MWYLQEQPPPVAANESPKPTPPSVLYWFGGVGGASRTIGRKNVDIRLKATSVSRTHATIRVQRSSFHKEYNGTVPNVEDSSAYGTFLKYPAGHHANRASWNDGHHDRLNKESPVELFEGALIAFGAPGGWWRVSWYPVLAYPHGLDKPQTDHINRIVEISGLSVVGSESAWSSSVTHVVTPKCHASSTTFLRALVTGKYIVTPAWADSVCNMVRDSCAAASAAINDAAASALTAIPREEKYMPPFADEDVAMFDSSVLMSPVFGTEKRKARSSLFSSVTFVFPNNDRRVHWNAILEACGAHTVLQSAADSATTTKLVDVRSSSLDPRLSAEPACTDRDIILAILTTDADPIFKASRGAASALQVAVPSVIPDIPTPAPSDSDAETADNDAAEDAGAGASATSAARALILGADGSDVVAQDVSAAPCDRKQKGGAIEHDDGKLVKDTSVLGRNASKRARAYEDADEDTTSKKSRRAEKDTVKLSGMANEFQGDDIVDEKDDDDMNPRDFFSVPDGDPGASASVFNDAAAGGSSSGVVDVRPFKRKTIPMLAAVPLRKARYTETDVKGNTEPSGFVYSKRSKIPSRINRAVVEDDENEPVDDDDDNDYVGEEEMEEDDAPMARRHKRLPLLDDDDDDDDERDSGGNPRAIRRRGVGSNRIRR
jgi:hypothetical protein